MPTPRPDNKPAVGLCGPLARRRKWSIYEKANGASVDMAQALDIAVLFCAALSGLAVIARAASKPKFAMMIITTQPRGRRRTRAS